MIDRRTFLKLSAGALVLTAAGDDRRSGVYVRSSSYNRWQRLCYALLSAVRDSE